MKLEDPGRTWTSDAAKAFFDQIGDEIKAHADRTFGRRQMTAEEYADARQRFENEVAASRKEAASLVARFTVPKPIVVKK